MARWMPCALAPLAPAWLALLLVSAAAGGDFAPAVTGGSDVRFLSEEPLELDQQAGDADEIPLPEAPPAEEPADSDLPEEFPEPPPTPPVEGEDFAPPIEAPLPEDLAEPCDGPVGEELARDCLNACGGNPSCCDPDGGACCLPRCCYGRYILAGVEGTFLHVHPGGSRLAFSNLGNQLVGSNFLKFDGLQAAPRVWLGVENGAGLGLRARYWTIEDEEFGSLSQGGVQLDGRQSFNLDTIDVELTRRFVGCNGYVLAGIGVRHAELQRDFSFRGAVPIDLATASVNSYRHFDATGLTGSLECLRTLNGGPLGLFCQVRGSVLWGNSNAGGSSALAANLGIPALNTFATTDNGVLSVFELQAGLQWSQPMACWHGHAIARVMFEYQHWNADESGFRSNDGVGFYNLAWGSQPSQVDLTGLAVAVGFSR